MRGTGIQIFVVQGTCEVLREGPGRGDGEPLPESPTHVKGDVWYVPEIGNCTPITRVYTKPLISHCISSLNGIESNPLTPCLRSRLVLRLHVCRDLDKGRRDSWYLGDRDECGVQVERSLE